jgi:hypothetical protein
VSVSVYNRWRLAGFQENPQATAESVLIGATVLSADVSALDVTVTFDNDLMLIIGLADKDYRGPEAMVVRGPAGECLVIN